MFRGKRVIEAWSEHNTEVKGVVLAKGEKVKWTVYLHQGEFEPIYLKPEFRQSLPYFNTVFTITYWIFKTVVLHFLSVCLFLQNRLFIYLFILNRLFKKNINNPNSNVCFTC